MHVIKFALLVLFTAANIVLAQDNPGVEIILSQPNAKQGDIVRADVFVRGGTNVAGIDIGVQVDERCLRILDRQPGGYLPTTDAEGAFSAFSELNEHDTRLASALTDRTKYVNGDGIFYFIQLEVLCEQGTAPVNVSYAKVSSYEDPTAEIIEVVSYDLDRGTLSVSDTQLEIVPAEQVAAVPTNTLTSPQPEQIAAVPANSGEATSQSTSNSQDQTFLIGAISLMVIGLFGLVMLFVFERRRRSRHL